jgi:cation transport ATPase
MVQNTQHQDRDAGNKTNIAQTITYVLALILVLVGLLNVTPAIPGWDSMWQHITGNDFFRVRRFSTEWLFPLVFFWMMLIVVFKHSIWKSWHNRQFPFRVFGLCLDIALALAAAAISVSYLIELEAVCLLDVFTGDRARLVAEALQAEVEFAELYGLPAPDTADDPACLYTTGTWLL